MENGGMLPGRRRPRLRNSPYLPNRSVASTIPYRQRNSSFRKANYSMSQPKARSFLTGLRCLRCGRSYAPGELEYVCPCRPNEGSDLGHLDAVYDYDAIVATRNRLAWPAEGGGGAATRSIERWWPLLPVRVESLPPLPVGDTPLLRAERLADALGIDELYVKDDGRNPSASLKDRASAIALARAHETEREVVAAASTGNAAAALAALAASAAQATVIFVPRSAPQGESRPAPRLREPCSGRRRHIRRCLRPLC